MYGFRGTGDLRLAPSRAHFGRIVTAILRVVKNYGNKTACIGVLKLCDSMLGSGHLREFGHAAKRRAWMHAEVAAVRQCTGRGAANEITFWINRSGEHERNEDGAAYLEARRKSWRERTAIQISL